MTTYYEQNKDKILQQRKDYYDKHKKELNMKSLLYYYDNKDKWKEYHKKNLVLEDLRKKNRHINRQIEILNRKIRDKTIIARNLRTKCNVFQIQNNVTLIFD